MALGIRFETRWWQAPVMSPRLRQTNKLQQIPDVELNTYVEKDVEQK